MKDITKNSYRQEDITRHCPLNSVYCYPYCLSIGIVCTTDFDRAVLCEISLSVRAVLHESLITNNERKHTSAFLYSVWLEALPKISQVNLLFGFFFIKSFKTESRRRRHRTILRIFNVESAFPYVVAPSPRWIADQRILGKYLLQRIILLQRISYNFLICSGSTAVTAGSFVGKSSRLNLRVKLQQDRSPYLHFTTDGVV